MKFSTTLLIRSVVILVMAVAAMSSVALGTAHIYLGVRPDLAATSFPFYPRGEAAQAVKMIMGATPDRRVVELAKSKASDVLAIDPMNAQALVVVGAVAAYQGSLEDAHEMFAAGWRRTKRDNLLTAVNLGAALKLNDTPTALEVTDVLMRRRPQMIAELGPPIFNAMNENVAFRGGIYAMLERNPPWKSQFLTGLGGLAPISLVESFLDHPSSARSRGLVGGLLATRFIDAGKLEEAAAASRRATGPVRELDLKLPSQSAESRFDWRAVSGTGADVTFPQSGSTDGAATFYVNDSGPEADLLVRHFALEPGRYAIEARLSGMQADRYAVRISCLGANALARLEGRPSQTGLTAIPFDVPEAGCPIVIVAVARKSSEQAIGAEAVAAFGTLRKIG